MISRKARLHFFRDLASMIGARLSVEQALKTARDASSSASLRQVLGQVLDRLRQGQPLSECFRRFPQVFDPLLVNLARVGEASGRLDQVLLQVAEHAEGTYALKRKVRSALAYPVLVLFVAIGAVGFFLTHIVPTFAELFATFSAELPGPTRFVIRLGEGLSAQPVLLVLIIAGVVLSIALGKRTSAGQRLSERLQLRLPVVGQLVRNGLMARFCRTLGLVLANGVTLVEALDLMARTMGHAGLEDEIQGLARTVRSGRSLREGLARQRVFPPLVAQMIAVGEQTAELPATLQHLGEHYEREVRVQVETLTSMLEPVLVLVVGLIVGGLLMAMYLPMFELVNVIQ